MKKLLSLILALLMVCVVLAACEGNKKTDDDDASDDATTTVTTTVSTTTEATTAPTTASTTVTTTAAASSDEDIVAAYVEKYGQGFLDGFKSGFESSGLTCEGIVAAVGTGMVVEVYCNEFVDVTDDVKDQMQAAFDAQQEVYEQALEALQNEVPQMTYLLINFCDANGELIALIFVGE